MYSLENLENKWCRYRRRKLIPSILISILFLCASAIYIYHKTAKNISLDVNATMSAVISKGNTCKSISKAKINDLSTQVPSLEDKYYVDTTKIGQIIFETKSKKTKKKNNLLIQITDRDSSKNIALDIERRFKFTKDKYDAIFLSKYYYDKEDYSKSEYWALETNRIDTHLEDGWILFAKAQAKQGKRIEALRVLQVYLTDNKSARAKSLIDKIRRGRKF